MSLLRLLQHHCDMSGGQHRFCIGNGLAEASLTPPTRFSHHRPTRQAPWRSVAPAHSRSRTVTPIPFFIRLGRNPRVNAFNCAVKLAAPPPLPPAPVKLPVQPQRRFYSSCTAVIKTSQWIYFRFKHNNNLNLRYIKRMLERRNA